jgi:hypothetical protein
VPKILGYIAGTPRSVQALSEAGLWSEAVAMADRTAPGVGASDQLLIAAVEATCQHAPISEAASKGREAGFDAEEQCSESLKWCLRIKSEELRAKTALKHLSEHMDSRNHKQKGRGSQWHNHGNTNMCAPGWGWGGGVYVRQLRSLN